MLRRLTAARATKNRVRATPSAWFFSATFFCARKNASDFSLSNEKNVSYRQTLCAIRIKGISYDTVLTVLSKNG